MLNQVAITQLKSLSGSLDEEELRAYCDGRIARFKVPHYVRFVDGFPMTVTGKIRKHEMRALEIAERGLVEAATA